MARYQVFINSINIYATDNMKHFSFHGTLKNLLVCQCEQVEAMGDDRKTKSYAGWLFNVRRRMIKWKLFTFHIVDKYVANLMDFNFLSRQRDDELSRFDSSRVFFNVSITKQFLVGQKRSWDEDYSWHAWHSIVNSADLAELTLYHVLHYLDRHIVLNWNFFPLFSFSAAVTMHERVATKVDNDDVMQ